MDTEKNTSEADSSLDEPLSLSQILLGTLPPNLLTDSAPETYRVEVVFNRGPKAEEVEEILSESTQSTLVEAGYTDITLHIANHRLVIDGSNLKELHDGLAKRLADILESANSSVRKERANAHDHLMEPSQRELERITAVRALTESVVFRPSRPGHDDRLLIARNALARGDRIQEERWDSEGGHA